MLLKVRRQRTKEILVSIAVKQQRKNTMKRFIITIAALLVSAALVSSAMAGPRGRSGGGRINSFRISPKVHFQNHNVHFQTNRFRNNCHPVQFRRRVVGCNYQHFCRYSNYRGWSSSCYLPRYNCRCYYCPTACCWYYWYAPFNCYLPYDYIQQYPPIQVTNVNNNTNINVNTNINNSNVGGAPALPPGATPLPQGSAPTLSGTTTPPVPGA